MTLLVSAGTYVERLRDLGRLRSLAHEAQRFRTRAQQLTRAAEELSGVSALRAALGAAGIAVTLDGPISADLVARVRQLREQFAADPNAVLSTDSPLERFLTPVNRASAELRAATSRAWRRQVEERIGVIPEDLLNVLARIPQFALTVTALRAGRAATEQLAAVLPAPDAAAVQAALDTADRIARENADNVARIGGIPDEVVTFLQLSVVGQARLHDVSDGVRAWLAAEKLLAVFRVSPAS